MEETNVRIQGVSLLDKSGESRHAAFADDARLQLIVKFRQAGLGAPEAEDLAQECLIDLLERVDRFDSSKGSLEAWVGGFARNAVRGWYQRESTKRLTETSLDHIGEVAHPVRTPLEGDAISHCLVELGVIDRELMHMRFAMGMSFDDIAASTDLTPMNCRKRVSRAVEKLRRDPLVRESLGL